MVDKNDRREKANLLQVAYGWRELSSLLGNPLSHIP